MTTIETQATIALDQAILYVERDYALTPVTITREASGKKKAKFHRGWRHESAWSRDPDQIRAWWVDHPDTSFALGCAANDLEGVDLDVKPAEGVDSVSWWAERGLPLGRLCQTTPSGGLHSIWAVRGDGLALPQEAGKTLGRGIDTRNRSGLFFAAGSYVLGEPGNYEISGELPHRTALTTTPDEVIALFADAVNEERVGRPSDGRIVHHQLEWQRQMVEAALEAVRDHPRDAGGYRRKLQHAGLFLGRIVEQGLLTPGKATSMLTKAHMSVWGPSLWPENLKDIRDALADGPRLERWREPAPEGGEKIPHEEPAGPAAGPEESGESGEEDDEDLSARVFEREVAAEVRKQDVREAATRARRARERAGRPPLAARMIDVRSLREIPPPTWLVKGVIPDRSFGFLAGKYGTYKSFLAVSLACHLAAGRAWLGRAEFAVRKPVRVLYVASEGAHGVAERVEAWEHAHGELSSGSLRVYPEPIRLNDPDDVEELSEFVEECGIGLVIVDTFHRSAPSIDENGSGDVGPILEAMAKIRDRFGTTTLFVDHTGHAGRTMRGSSAKGDDGEFVLLVDLPGDERGPEVQRTLRVAKFKDAPTAGEWPLRLVPVAEVGEDGSAYLEIGAVRGATDGEDEFFRAAGWQKSSPDVPDEVAGLKGDGSAIAIDIFRVLRHVNDPEGLTKSDIGKALEERPGKSARSSRLAAFALLKRNGITVPGESAARVALPQKYWRGT